MGLNHAHKGYEYQDLIISYFILKEIIDENTSEFKVDTKEYSSDKFDDLTITNKNGIFKKQIKYGSKKPTRRISKKDLSANTPYQIALDILFESWKNHPDRKVCDFRLCLSWDEPTDELIKILKPSSGGNSFSNYKTNLYQVSLDKLWPSGKLPLYTWKRFRSESQKIDRNEFSNFLNSLHIELNFPEFSQDIQNPGQLEKIIMVQIDKLGIGYFPNNQSPEGFASKLLLLVKRLRSSGESITVQSIFNYFNINTSYGAINQLFPINHTANIKPDKFSGYIFNKLKTHSKILLTGEPGSGKSWFIENLKEYLIDKKIHVIRHLCYTDLEDVYQKERIQLNTFYGNLINGILELFPELKAKKEKRFASNLSELNNLLSNINKPTVLIVDGIDHINRIFHFKNYSEDLSLKDVDIIDKINELNISPHVKILLSTQPISELSKIHGFVSETIPQWGNKEVKAYIKKQGVLDVKLKKDETLSSFLLTKSNGNPLYLKYLTDEIKGFGKINSDNIKKLPEYSLNLVKYYSYLLSKLNLAEQLPRILCGVNFSLTKSELIEITGDGKYIEESLKIMEPVIKINISQNGYIIYHESFRRYIFEELKSKNVSTDKVIFEPIIKWFEEKGIYKYMKSFRFYFQYTYELDRIDKLITHVKQDFVTQSISYGHSWDSIENNYRYLTKAVLKKRDFPKIILLSELNKVLSSTKDEFYGYYRTYLDALGHIRGFQYVSDYLSFDGNPTLDKVAGLEACYLCSKHGVAAPWDLYMGYFQKGKTIKEDDLKYYVRHLLVTKNEKEIDRIATKIRKHDLQEYVNTLRNEIIGFEDKSYVTGLIKASKILTNFFNPTKAISFTKDAFEKLADEVLKYEYIEKDKTKIIPFINSSNQFSDDEKFIETIIKKFTGISWFYNWIVFAVKVKLIKSKSTYEYFDVKQIFEILIYDTAPFKGTPRACDLYPIEGFIYKTIKEGLSLLKFEDSWDEIINILVKLSDETTTLLQKSPGGPLATPKLFQLLEESSSSTNLDYIIKVCEDALTQKEPHHLHAHLAEYNLKLAKLYSKRGNKELAYEKFKKGIEYLLGYTFRKDSTIEELTESIVSVHSFNKELGSQYIKTMKPLVDAVVEHTDGKGTSHFPVEWYSKYLDIDFNNSAIYLLNELLQTRVDWRLEESLQKLLIKADGSINPVIELLIVRTFIIENSENFLSYSLSVSQKAMSIDYQLSKKIVENICERSGTRREQGYSEEFISNLRKTLPLFKLENALSDKKINQKKEYGISNSNLTTETKKESAGNKFSEMKIPELAEFISQNELREKDLNCLSSVFNLFEELTDDHKELIKSFYTPIHKYSSNKIDTSSLFKGKNDVAVYYWVSRYVYDTGGWMESLVNIDALQKAYDLDKKKTIEFLCELLAEKIDLEYTRTLSANLLNGLIKIGFDDDIIKESWINLFNVIDYRLPHKEDFNWEKALRNDLLMTTEEVFICLLFSRFKSFTTERYEWTLAGIAYLLYQYPEKMVKPIKWFLGKRECFLDSIFLSIIQLIYEYEKANSGYINNFKVDFEKIYPTNFFLIDAIIEVSISKSKRKLLIKPPSLNYPIESKTYDFLMSSNFRHQQLLTAGHNLKNIFGKFASTSREKYGDSLEIYGNRMCERMVRQIYLVDYLLKLINEDLYDELYSYKNIEAVIESIRLDVRINVAQTQSNGMRPKDLDFPSKLNRPFMISQDLQISEGWVRIGYYEQELYSAAQHYKLKECKVFGGIDFSSASSKSFPYSGVLLSSEDIWTNVCSEEITNKLICSIIQRDSLEDYKVLWLNPNLLTYLKLRAVNFLKGLAAENEGGEIILKLNLWRCSYVGDGDRSDLSHEIPKLDGAELIIRNDYFDLICDFYKVSPQYSVMKVDWGIDTTDKSKE